MIIAHCMKCRISPHFNWTAVLSIEIEWGKKNTFPIYLTKAWTDCGKSHIRISSSPSFFTPPQRQCLNIHHSTRNARLMWLILHKKTNWTHVLWSSGIQYEWTEQQLCWAGKKEWEQSRKGITAQTYLVLSECGSLWIMWTSLLWIACG